jgi:hypothetical protein
VTGTQGEAAYHLYGEISGRASSSIQTTFPRVSGTSIVHLNSSGCPLPLVDVFGLPRFLAAGRAGNVDGSPLVAVSGSAAVACGSKRKRLISK